MSKITEAVRRITALAPVPEMLPLLTRLMRDPTANLDEITEVVRRDMDLTASLLKRCNSALHRGSEPVDSVDDAMLRLGLDAVLEIVLALVSSRMYRLPPETETALRGLWDHALLTAIYTRELMRNTEVSRSVAFTAGLLHDIGKVFLIKADPAEYVQTLQKARQRHRATVDQEEEELGTNHATVGGEMLSRWKLPASIVTGIWLHHHTELGGEQNPLARAIEVADTLTYLVGFGLADQYARCPNTAHILEELKVEPGEIPTILTNGLTEADEVRKSLH